MKKLNNYRVTFYSGAVMDKIPAKRANHARILAQGEAIMNDQPYGVKRVQLLKVIKKKGGK